MPIRARIVLGPEGQPAMIIACEAPGLLIAVERAAREHQPSEGEFSLVLPVRRQRDVAGAILGPRKLLELLLERVHRPKSASSAPDRDQHSTNPHWVCPDPWPLSTPFSTAAI